MLTTPRPQGCITCGTPVRPWCNGQANFWVCGACGLAFRHPMPDAEALAALYREAYSAASLAAGAPAMLSPDQVAQHHASLVARLCPPPGRVLDFGAGTGALAHWLQQQGYEVLAVEASEEAAAEARRRHGLRVYRDLAELESAEPERFDVVTCVEVIEHLIEPMPILAGLGSLLKPGGKLYLTTPNRNGLLARLQRCRWREARDPCHLVLYSYRALSLMLGRAQFEAIRLLRFSPLTVDQLSKVLLHRALQALGLYGGLRVMAQKRAGSGAA